MKATRERRVKELIKLDWIDRMKDSKRYWKWFKFYKKRGINNEEGC